MKRGPLAARQPGSQFASVMRSLGVKGSRRPPPPPGGGFPRAAVLCLLVAGGCGGGGSGDPPPPPLPLPPPPPPATVSLAVAADTGIKEAANPKVQVTVQLDASASASVTVELNFAGSAVRGRDYAVDTGVVEVPANAASAVAEIDVYRDFDEEGDETIEVSLGTITGNAQAGGLSSVTLTILDGEAAAIYKTPGDEDEDDGEDENFFEQVLAPLEYTVTEEAVVVAVAAVNALPAGETAPLVAEWSTDFRFQTGVRRFGAVDVESVDIESVEFTGDPFDLFLGNVHQFKLPMADLAPNEVYYIRVYLGEEPPPSDEFAAQFGNTFFDGFATNAEGRVVVRCEAPERTAMHGGDPLFTEQWHLNNTGQTAFSDRAGVAGADLRMTGVIAANQTGSGVKLAVVDQGLETCHPDLAANAGSGGSFNFGYERTAGAGASPHEPFYFGLLGDHGTSVAGIAAAAANNGLGGRGVAPDVTVVGFNPVEAASGTGEDQEASLDTALLLSLGGSDSDPDSASVDIFNMSFGAFAPSENSREEFVRLLKMATTELREGRGALYVKAAGNDFGFCGQTYQLSREVGCIASNAYPDQNLPWLINVGGFNADDLKSSYSSAGANLWVVGPSGEDGVEAPAMITTDQAGAHGGYSEYSEYPLTSAHPLNRDGDYFSAFGGTSSAAPAVSGALAVLLGVNPMLTWRDMKHILARSARMIDPGIAEVRAAFNGVPYVAQHAWQTNAAGYNFHNWYGFGAVDVDAAVAVAESYTPDSLGSFVESEWFDAGAAPELPQPIPDADGAGVTATLGVTGLPDSAGIEAVVLEIAADHANAFDLGITLHSPAGTASVVNPPFNVSLDGFPGFWDWHLLSNAFYGENPNGAWTVHVADLAAGDTGSLTGLRLRFYYGEH